MSSIDRRHAPRRHRRGKNAKRNHKSVDSVKTPNEVVYRPSFKTGQIVPDRYFVWLDLFNVGQFPAGGGANYGFALNNINFPLNNTGANGLLPSLEIAAGTCDPAGLKNLLFNSTTSAGLWTNYRVWKVAVEFCATPQANVDTLLVAMAPVLGSGSNYGTNATMVQGPNSCYHTCSTGQGNHNTLKKMWSLPQLLGVPDRDYGALSLSTYGTYGVPPVRPVFLQIDWAAETDVNTTLVVPYTIKVRYFVEFFQRCDTALIDTVSLLRTKISNNTLKNESKDEVDDTTNTPSYSDEDYERVKDSSHSSHLSTDSPVRDGNPIAPIPSVKLTSCGVRSDIPIYLETSQFNNVLAPTLRLTSAMNDTPTHSLNSKKKLPSSK